MISAAGLSIEAVRERKTYTCRKCNVPRKGHVCPYAGLPPPFQMPDGKEEDGRVDELESCRRCSSSSVVAVDQHGQPLAADVALRVQGRAGFKCLDCGNTWQRNLKVYMCLRCGVPKRGHVCPVDGSSPAVGEEPARQTFLCPVPGCSKIYQTQSGLYQHKRTVHGIGPTGRSAELPGGPGFPAPSVLSSYDASSIVATAGVEGFELRVLTSTMHVATAATACRLPLVCTSQPQPSSVKRPQIGGDHAAPDKQPVCARPVAQLPASQMPAVPVIHVVSPPVDGDASVAVAGAARAVAAASAAAAAATSYAGALHSTLPHVAVPAVAVARADSEASEAARKAPRVSCHPTRKQPANEPENKSPNVRRAVARIDSPGTFAAAGALAMLCDASS